MRYYIKFIRASCLPNMRRRTALLPASWRVSSTYSDHVIQFLRLRVVARSALASALDPSTLRSLCVSSSLTNFFIEEDFLKAKWYSNLCSYLLQVVIYFGYSYFQGNQQSGGFPGGGPNQGGGGDKDKANEQKKKWEPPVPTRVGKKKKRGPDAATKLPPVVPTTRCRLKLLKMERIKDYLLLEEEFIQNQERVRPESAREEKNEEARTMVDDLRGSPMAVGTLEEIIDDDHAIISTSSGPEFYVSIMSFVDKDALEPGCSVLLHHKNQAVVGVLQDDTDPMVSVMKLDKAPTESYADVGGLDQQIQEIKVSLLVY